VTERQRIRCKQLPDGLKRTRKYWKLEVEALDHTAWRTLFGRGCAPVIRKTVRWKNAGLSLCCFLPSFLRRAEGIADR
jgi:hypothetical protein